MDRFSTQLPPPRGRQVSAIDAAHANEFFEPFLNAATLKNILGYYRSICDHLHLKPNVFPQFYPKLKTYLTTWRAKALWKKFDARASHKCYGKGKICANTRVLIIGAGPCGLRTAIEAQLLGAKVVVVEKRDRLSRNNVLHLWPFVIEDLRMLGAKKFFGKFCAGAIDHISIRQLQCILLKVALLLGVEVHTEVSFEKLIEPNAEEKIGWTAEFKPSNHPVSQYEFDVIIGADGKKNTLQGFKRKEFRGKLAIAITANFINKKTEAEARVEEISGVAFIFNQKFFKNLQEETRIDLENIVYYKDDTHYFVMTAKKASLLEKGVIKQDFADTEQLLSRDNVDRIALQNYAKEAANFSTNYQMPDLEFAVNHYGQPDVNMFDFTSMYQAENASKVMERRGYRLLMILVGDSLLEPFWPTGSGCARGFLSSLDAAWAIRSWGLGNATPLEVMAERESIYRLLPQTTPDNLNKDWKSYTLDPSTRYPNLNKNVISDIQTTSLFDTDNPQSIEEMRRTIREVQLEPQPKKRRRGNVDSEVLLNWINEQLCEHELQADDIGSIFKNGKILCAIVHHYRPDLLDINAINDDSPEVNNQMAFDVLEKELGVPPIITGEESTKTEDFLTLASYLTQVYDTFRGEIPHIKLPKLPLPSKIPVRQINPPSNPSVLLPNTISKTSNSANNFDCKINKDGTVRVIYEKQNLNNPIDTKRMKVQCACCENYKAIVNNKLKKIRITKRKCSKSCTNINGCCKINESKVMKVEENFQFEVQKPPPACFIKIKPESSIGSNNFIISLNVNSDKKIRRIRYNRSKLSVIREGNAESIPSFNNAETNTETGFCKHCNKLLVDNFCSCSAKKMQDEKELNTEKHEINNKIDLGKQFLESKENSEMFYSETNYDIQNKSNSNTTATSYYKSFTQSDELNEHKTNSKEKQLESAVSTIKIRLVEKKSCNEYTFRKIKFDPELNLLTVSSKITVRSGYYNEKQKIVGQKFDNRTLRTNQTSHFDNNNIKSYSGYYHKFSSNIMASTDFYRCNMDEAKCHDCGQKFYPEEIVRVSHWIHKQNFNNAGDKEEPETIDNEASKINLISNSLYEGLKVEERTEEIKCGEVSSSDQTSSENSFTKKMKSLACDNKGTRTLTNFLGYSPLHNMSNMNLKSNLMEGSQQFSVIAEGEETELPESNKRSSEASLKPLKGLQYHHGSGDKVAPITTSRPSSKHKRHAEAMTQSKLGSMERKTRKRRTLEKVGASVFPSCNNMTSLFIRATLESSYVAVLLFIFDILLNSEQYGYENYFFRS